MLVLILVSLFGLTMHVLVASHIPITLPILRKISTPLGGRPLRGQYERAVGNATPHHVYFSKLRCLLDR